MKEYPLHFQRKSEGVRSISLSLPYSSQHLDRDRTDATLRANPFIEVTDLFFRLLLPTLLYQLEAAKHGDLVLLSVQP